MKKSIILSICTIVSILMSGCTSSDSTTYYYGFDTSSVSDIVSGSKASLEADIASAMAVYSGRTNCEEDMAGDFRLVCKSYDDKVQGVARLVKSMRMDERQKLVEPIYEITRYTFESKIRPAE